MAQSINNQHIGQTVAGGLAVGIETAIDYQVESLPQYLTPDTLLAYCASRLQTLDTEIKERMAGQEARNNGIRDASRLMQLLSGWQGHHGSAELKADTDGAAKDRTNHASEANDILDLYKNTKDAQVKDQCARFFNSLTGQDIHGFVSADGKTITKVTPENIKAWADADKIDPCDAPTWQAMVGSVKDMQGDMSKSSELDMIGLQSLVSQRQLSVQLTTQLMQAVNEGPKQAAANIGR
jgi:hypothetical protein